MKGFKRWVESKGLDYRVWDQSSISTQLDTMQKYIDYTKTFPDGEMYNNYGGVTAQEAMDNMGDAIYGICDKCHGTGEVLYKNVCVSGEIRTRMISCPKCWGEKTLKKVTVSTEKKWIDLDIDNLPDRFFTRDDIEIQIKHDDWDMWKQSHLEKEVRYKTIEHLVLTDYKYRYRIQENKPIQITNKMLTSLIDDYFLHIPVNKTREQFRDMISIDNDGREVIIID